MLGRDKRNQDTPSFHCANFIKCSGSHDVSDQSQFEKNEDAKMPWLHMQLLILLSSSCHPLFEYIWETDFSQSVLIYILLLPLTIYDI